MYGSLLPVAGGTPIPLTQKRLIVGRRKDCDVVLPFANVSGKHCELYLEDGYWYVKDLGSSNGTKLNGARIKESYLPPNGMISFAHNHYKMEYSPEANGATMPPPQEEAAEQSVRNIFGRSLLQRAGLSRNTQGRQRDYDTGRKRFDPEDNSAGQLRKDDDWF
ncbi:MAG: FHA domain-containing protein [Planctomycetia bacterium]|nr:FHA domain-containing protein [Planctomycetia bacterium]